MFSERKRRRKPPLASRPTTRDQKPVTVGCIASCSPLIPHGCVQISTSQFADIKYAAQLLRSKRPTLEKKKVAPKQSKTTHQGPVVTGRAPTVAGVALLRSNVANNNRWDRGPVGDKLRTVLSVHGSPPSSVSL